MLKRQEDMLPPTTTPEIRQDVSVVTAVFIGCLVGFILVFMIYIYVPRPAFINRFLVWWYFTRHTSPLPSLPTAEGQQQNPMTSLPAQNNDNHGNDGTQDPPIDNTNNNNNNNTIELTDFMTNISPLNATQN